MRSWPALLLLVQIVLATNNYQTSNVAGSSWSQFVCWHNGNQRYYQGVEILAEGRYYRRCEIPSSLRAGTGNWRLTGCRDDVSGQRVGLGGQYMFRGTFYACSERFLSTVSSGSHVATRQPDARQHLWGPTVDRPGTRHDCRDHTGYAHYVGETWDEPLRTARCTSRGVETLGCRDRNGRVVGNGSAFTDAAGRFHTCRIH